MDRHIEQAVELGRANQRVIKLLHDHCTLARVQWTGGGVVAQSYQLPVGLGEIRCEHASRGSSLAMDFMWIATEFYENNCEGCTFRSPTGNLPTIASVVETARQERAATNAQRREELAELRAAWQKRKDDRSRFVAAEGYPSRDLVRNIDVVDAEPGTDVDFDDHVVEDARRAIEQTARLAPELFSEILIDTIVVMATESYDGLAQTVLRLLAEANVISPRRAVKIAAKALSREPFREAGQTVAEFARELTAEEVTAVLGNAIVLSSENDEAMGFARHMPTEPAALLALVAVDPTSVLSAILERLSSNSDVERAQGAYAARHFLKADASKICELGRPLVLSIREEDEGYAGRPRPAGAAKQAIAEAWRQAPDATCQIVEEAADLVDETARKQLVGIVRMMKSFRSEDPIPDDALRVGVSFLVRRLNGEWGTDAADVATEDLETLARDYPDQMLDQGDALIAALISECQPELQSELIRDSRPNDPQTNSLRQLERMSELSSRRARIRRLGEAIGSIAKFDGAEIIPKVLTMLQAESGDEELDSRTRVALLNALAHAVTAKSISKFIPNLYTTLLSRAAGVRAAAVALWEACANSAMTLPAELDELAPRIAMDSFVAVHGAMAAAAPRLKIGDAATRVLTDAFFSLANHYRQHNDQTILRDAICAMLSFAERVGDDHVLEFARAFTIAIIPELASYDREPVLLSRTLLQKRATQEWATAAIAILAEPSRRDRFNQRDDRVYAALLDEPAGLLDIPLDSFRAVANIDLPEYINATAEMVELLQVAGRWSDAAVLAEESADAISTTTEYRELRALAYALATAAQNEAYAVAGTMTSISDVIAPDGHAHEFVAQAQAMSSIRNAVSSVPLAHPLRTAESISSAIASLETITGGDARIDLYVDIGKLAITLLRADAAIRAADIGSVDGLLGAARRNATVLRSTALGELASNDPIRLWIERAAQVQGNEIDLLLTTFRTIALPLAISEGAIRRKRRGKILSVAAADHFDNRVTLAKTVAVCLLRLNHIPIVDVVIMRKGIVYDLNLEIRLAEWPDWADECRVDFLSTVPVDAMTRPSFIFGRGDVDADEMGVTLSSTGTIFCSIDRLAGSDPIDLPLHVRFSSGAGRSELSVIGGYERLRLRPYDATRDAMTGQSQLDQRLLEVYDRLYDDPQLDADDVQAFCRLFTAIADGAIDIMFDKQFRTGKRITEGDFHNALEKRLKADPRLEGRLSRRDPLAGGFDDLLHDDIVAELKVEKSTPRTVADCARYIGQPTQYGVGRGSRLSILVILEHTKKTTPPGVLENYVGWLDPAQHNLTDPRYPSHVGVIIINTNWPVPSTWSRRKIRLRDVTERGATFSVRARRSKQSVLSTARAPFRRE